jgi:hypothetical protein
LELQLGFGTAFAQGRFCSLALTQLVGFDVTCPQYNA